MRDTRNSLATNTTTRGPSNPEQAEEQPPEPEERPGREREREKASRRRNTCSITGSLIWDHVGSCDSPYFTSNLLSHQFACIHIYCDAGGQVTTAIIYPDEAREHPLSWRMSPVSSRRCLAQQSRDVVQHNDRLVATGQRNEPRTTNLIQRAQDNQLWPHTCLRGDIYIPTRFSRFSGVGAGDE